MPKTRLALVAPAFNEEAAIADWIRSVDQFFDPTRFASLDLIVVDDGSADRTHEVCLGLVREMRHIQLHPLRLARNFGHQSALTCGLQYAVAMGREKVDCVVTMDSDGEHPLSVIPELLREWEKGALLVHTKRREHAHLGFIKKLSSRIFYRTIQKLAKLPIEEGMADFKLWDVRLLESVSGYLETCGALRLFAVYLAPKGPRVEFDQRVIAGRVSRFSTRKMFSLAAQSIVYYSGFPMRLIGLLGAFSLVFSLAVTLQALWAFLTGHAVPGWTSLMVALSFFAGMNTLCLFIVAEYLLRFSFRSKLPPFVRVT